MISLTFSAVSTIPGETYVEMDWVGHGECGLNDQVVPFISRRQLDHAGATVERRGIVEDFLRRRVAPVHQKGRPADIPFEQVGRIVAYGRSEIV